MKAKRNPDLDLRETGPPVREHPATTPERDFFARGLDRDLVDSLLEGVVGIDAQGIIRFANAAAVLSLGYQHEHELLGRNCHQTTHHSHADRRPYPEAHCPIHRALKGGASLNAWAEDVYWRKNGTAFPVEVHVAPLHDATGTVLGALISFLDISRRVLAEDHLRQSERRFRALVEASPDGVLVHDSQTILYANRAAAELLGSGDPRQLIGREVLALLPCAADPSGGGMGSHTGSGATLRRRRWVLERLDDGQPMELECDVARITYDDQEAEQLILRDITQRKNTEANLRLASKVFESTTEGILVTDTHGHILTVNRAFTEITGYLAAEVLGRNPRFLSSGLHDSAFYSRMWKCIAAQGAWQGEIWNQRKNGDVFPQWLTINVVLDDGDLPTHYVAVFSDISRIKSSQEELEYLAHFDALTGLPNRVLLNLRMEQVIAEARRTNHPAALLLLDLDQFKEVNDGLGHAAGDEVLKAVAERLKRAVRAVDMVARFGGDEFIIVMFGVSGAQDAGVLANKIIADLCSPFTYDAQELVVNASVGISLYPNDGTTIAELLQHADAAMYQAKGKGGKRFCYYNRDMTEKALRRVTLETQLRRAIRNDEFELHYQEQVMLADEALVGLEALLRWNHPDEGAVPPSAFIPVAEQSSLILELGEWVLHEACRQGKAWMDQGVGIDHLSVNVSGAQLEQNLLSERVWSTLADTGFPSSRLKLEVTESFFLRNPDISVEKLMVLREAGVRVAIDDFGTGYSSLSYLKRLPIDTLKIDKSFVRGLPWANDDCAIVRAIIALAHQLRFDVVAEGVETRAQHLFLQQEGCDQGQGYLYAEPLPAGALRGRLIGGPGAAAAEGTG